MIYEINGTLIKTPSSCTWGLYYVSSEDSGRNTTDGKMSIDTIAVKRKLSGVTWANITQAECASILQAIHAQRMMSVKYADAMSGTIQTRTFYISDPSAPVYRWSDGLKIFSSLGFDFIEQ
jgi:hypothetical protein